MTIDQLSVFVENKAGKLAEITAVLADEGIDIRAMSIADTKDFGILRLIVNDADKAVSALKREQYIVSVTKVIAVAISDTPGSLAAVLRILSDNAISIEYMYAFITRRREDAYVVFRVEENERAGENPGRKRDQRRNAGGDIHPVIHASHSKSACQLAGAFHSALQRRSRPGNTEPGRCRRPPAPIAFALPQCPRHNPSGSRSHRLPGGMV